jgi:hypothetical protein
MNQLRQVEEILQRYRRIRYLLSKPEFEGIVVPQDLIDKGDADGIYEYLKRHLGLEDLTIAALRERAAVLRIMPIFGLSKSQLIEKIREKESESAKGKTNSC